MSKVRLLTIAVIALTAMNLFFLSRPFFGPPPEGGHHPPGGRGSEHKMDRNLDFDESQIKKHKDFREAHRKASIILKKELNGELKNLYKLIQADNFSNTKKDSLLRIIEEKTTRINELNVNHFLNIKSILRPEQEAGFNELIGNLGDEFDRAKKER